MEIVPPSTVVEPAGTLAAVGNGGDGGGAAASTALAWASLPNGPVLHDDGFTSAAAPLVETCAGEAIEKSAVVVLPGTGDSYTCCFTATGDADRPSPLGKLRVTWRPGEDARQGGSGKGVDGGGTSIAPVSVISEEAAEGGGEGIGGGQAVTEFPLPVLSARPPALSARLKAPPHARVGEEFSIR